jgi:type III secretion protein U
MASKDQGADKTEKPTPKRIRDARKEGNVSKSRELTATVLTLGWLVTGWLLVGFMYGRLQELFDQSLRAMQLPFRQALVETAGVAFQTLLWLSLPLLAMAVLLGLAIEFLQVGSIATMKKLTPNLEKMNPVEGIKKMFSMDNLVELIKSILKSAALLGIGWYVLMKMLPDLLQLPYGTPAHMASAIWYAIVRIVVWTIAVFFFVSALDVWYQKFSYTKQLRMSRRDIKQEVKENEGDPYVKSRRRQLHQEWAQQNMLSAVRGANVVVTNPTHIAVALQYELGETDLPVVVAKGEGALAEQIKQAAEEAGVPILQNVPLARGLNERVALDDYVDGEFFDAVAEVLFWAESVQRARADNLDAPEGPVVSEMPPET